MPLATVLLASIAFVPWPAPPSVTATSASREPVVRLKRTPSPRASYEGSDACQPQPPNVYYNQPPQVDKVAEFIRQETPGFDDQQWSPGAPNHDGANVAPSYDVNAAAPGYWAATGSYWATSEYDAQWTPSGVDAYEANVAPDFDPNQAIPPPLPVTDDPFVLLGLDPAFAGDVSAIRSSYLRQAKAYHPDASVTSATPEHIKQRINDDFSRIQAAYEQLRDGGGSVDRAASGTHRRPSNWQEGRRWHEGAGSTGYGFGQSMGVHWKSSVDPRTNAPKRAPPPPVRNSVKSYGFVGFMSDEERRAASAAAAAEAASASSAQAASAAVAQQAQQHPSVQAATSSTPLNESASANVTAAATATEPPQSPVADAAEAKVAGAEDHAAAARREAELALQQALRRALQEAEVERQRAAKLLVDLAAFEERYRCLEDKLQQAEERLQCNVQQADLLAAANRLERDRLEKKLHLAAEQMKKERQLHEERLAIMASGAAKKEEELREELLATHSEEKKEMDQKVKSIEARLREYTKPWYQQRPRGQMY